MRKITATKAKKITTPGMYRADTGLYLKVSPTGGKSWIQRIVINGVRHDLGLGGLDFVSLVEAQALAHENRKAVRVDGRNVLADKHRPSALSFEEAARKTYEAMRPRWRSEKAAENWWNQLQRYALNKMGDKAVDTITRADVLDVLSPVWTSRPEAARKVRRSMRATFAWCLAHGLVQSNVVDDVGGALPAQPSVAKNYRALPFAEVGEALETIRASKASLSARLCFEFTILTCCRSGEAREARWSEINLDAQEWRIPASRTKTNKEHRQPLSDQAVAIVERAQENADGSDLIFPSPNKSGQPLSNMTLQKILRDNGLADRCVVHGFRSSARSWMSERTSADYAVAELCLGHAVGNSVERSYRRSDLYDKRARLLQTWADFVCGSEPAKVVALHA